MQIITTNLMNMQTGLWYKFYIYFFMLYLHWHENEYLIFVYDQHLDVFIVFVYDVKICK